MMSLFRRTHEDRAELERQAHTTDEIEAAVTLATERLNFETQRLYETLQRTFNERSTDTGGGSTSS